MDNLDMMLSLSAVCMCITAATHVIHTLLVCTGK